VQNAVSYSNSMFLVFLSSPYSDSPDPCFVEGLRVEEALNLRTVSGSQILFEES
jgi:hypothetical protein